MGGTHGHQIGGVGAAVDHAAFVRSHHVHHLGTATEGGHRIAIAHGFGVGGQIGVDAIELLCSAWGHTKAGFHLVDQQQGAVLVTQIAQALKPCRCRRNTARIANDGLQHYASQGLGVGGKQTVQGLKAIELDDVEQATGAGRNASTKWNHTRCLCAMGIPRFDVRFPHHLVVQAVERAFNNRHPVSPGKTTRSAQRTHHSLGA